jgi:CheY-like chemotaxis protein
MQSTSVLSSKLMDDSNDYRKFAILYVDDEQKSLANFVRTFSDEFRVVTANNARDGLKDLEENISDIGVIIADQRMPGEKGTWLLERARQLRPDIIRILTTGYADMDAAITAVNSGEIYRYVTKPWDPLQLKKTLRESLKLFMLNRERSTSPKLEQSESAKSAKSKTLSSQPKRETKLFADGFTPSTIGDKPTSVDYLGRDKLARVLAAMFAAKAQSTPLTVAILGEWGVGKSTLMELIKKQLNPDGKSARFCLAEFNAWEYEHTDNIRAGLAQEVVNGLIKGLNWRERCRLTWQYAQEEHTPELRRILFKLIVVIITTCISTGLAYWWLDRPNVKALIGTAAFAGFATFVAIIWKNLKTIIEHPISTELTTYLKLPSYGEHLGEVPVIKRQLRKLCKLRLNLKPQKNGKEPRLIVFVDDLDRCSSECITDTFDAIRLVMDIPQVIMVIMIDHRIAIKAVAEQYRQLADLRQNKYVIARDYLGKIIQVPIMLLPPESDRIEEFIKRALFPAAGENRYLMEVPTESLAKPTVTTVTPIMVAGQMNASQTTDEQNTFLAGQDIQKEMEDTLDDREFFQQLTQTFGSSNPRHLLRLRNTFRLLKGIERENTGQQITLKRARQLMLMLFRLEFLHSHNIPELTNFENQMFTGEAVPDEGQELKHPIVKLFQKVFDEQFSTNAQPSHLINRNTVLETRLFVKRFVLPYHDDEDEENKSSS